MRYKIKTIKITLEVREKDSKQKIHFHQDAYDILQGIYKTLDADQEHFTILSLNVKLDVLGFKVICSGGQDMANVDPKVVFRNALLMGATSLILAHNHPSGDPTPSNPDIIITRKLIEGAKLLGIVILDHLILGDNNNTFISFKNANLLE